MRLLCVTAHPDDEAGGFGGSLLLYRGLGIETFVICLTPGMAATHRGDAQNGDQLAAIRRLEFARSCELLRVSHAEVLNHPDGGLDKMDFLEVVGDLTRRIRQIRPHVVLTFGSEGGVTGHSDHCMTSIFTTMAFHWAGRNNRFADQLGKEGLAPHRAQKLYYSTVGFQLTGRQPVAPAQATAAIDIRKHLETKISAFKLHTSQAPLFSQFEEWVRRRGNEEQFHLAAVSTPRPMEFESDLFAGVSE